MDDLKYENQLQNDIPDDLIVFISGVPGVGKTTVSYELLRNCNKFRLIQETDLIREILRGYTEYLNDFLCCNSCHSIVSVPEIIPNHIKIFTYDEMKIQSAIMKCSIERIVLRQQRKHIPSIINGVHIVPEVLSEIANGGNVVFVNLYINNKEVLRKRLSTRNPKKYMPHIEVLFDANNHIFSNVKILSQDKPRVFQNIDVTEINVDQVVEKILCFVLGND